ncbi:putative tRNA sulfurtransferase [Thermobispora bispora]|uniref:Probable tRNA sulfurtransferase n=1 Tax=Thermobispora bispora (strain ATCC 19993 / DSM 43833 / CBS 139.67 / JCM 10125 / KCTC 9307 / NBRC 14880 / R51) TaxID=469371 RepID=D6Y9C5_THEBD|nr:tRNA uracil 4-sulfurtransferase ThiI [Thermobispora bispora]MBO2474174.1 tRNA 4-thiouridine(8) synthase ThiI [Actinomycetales bacterium]MDI9581040.1 tRNA uracil 4-sulfurtransferase ThiI [Thermobispora sp.]ADG88045.1 thiamine biosynthesis/tRNA modification protein ThiI [Thermobispora bispora DSM 43833]MBX6167713.1 tRNA 4-thiouridine(8) synthase ThiI [Thermobispora bispora]QSI47911.1 tRNA 4-thiouridine(8) synthase ThiI [Thermobispora bispora]
MPFTALGEPCVLLKLGEVVLKGRNRDLFETRLRANVKHALKDHPIRLRQRHGVIVVFLPKGAGAEVAEAVAKRATEIPGIVLVQLAWRVPKDPDAITKAAVELVRDSGKAESGARFAVRSRRRDKRFPLRSNELDRLVGGVIKDTFGLPVDLTDPELTVYIEVDRDEAFLYTDGLQGTGGLPVGSSGRALALLSGGIDSPVAAYRMMRRGLRVDFLHFSGIPYTTSESIYKAYALVRTLDKFQGRSRLWVVPFGKAQQSIKASGQDRLAVIAQRRLMLKTAAEVARRIHAEALITGDSLGQVSSQTLANITAQDNAVELPILRPLIGMDKAEIIAEARRIGTLEISELPDEDCCTLLAPRSAETRAKIEDLRQIERRLDAEELAVQLADSIRPYMLEA